MEVVRKGIIAGHLQMFSVSTVLGEKSSDVGAVLMSICQASWPSPTTTLDRKRTTKRRRNLRCVEGFAVCLFLLGVCMGGCVSECLSLRCYSSAQDRGVSAKLPGRRPPPHWAGRAQVNEGVMFGESKVLLRLF